MPQFLYRLQPTRVAMLSEGMTPQEEDTVGQHFAYLQEQVEKGVVLMAGRTLTDDADTFGIVVYQADSDASARHIMENDPAVLGGVMTARLYPYAVALWSQHGPSGAP